MKTVLKWNPYLDFELSAQEAWLEELSRRGCCSAPESAI